jgi:hypothetical protein
MKPQTEIILIRFVNGVGINKKGLGYTIEGKPIKRSYLGNRLCFRFNNKTIGYKTLAQSKPVNIIIPLQPKKLCPF